MRKAVLLYGAVYRTPCGQRRPPELALAMQNLHCLEHVRDNMVGPVLLVLRHPPVAQTLRRPAARPPPMSLRGGPRPSIPHQPARHPGLQVPSIPESA